MDEPLPENEKGVDRITDQTPQSMDQPSKNIEELLPGGKLLVVRQHDYYDRDS